MTKSNNLKWNFGEPQIACTYKLYTKVKTDVFPPFCIKKARELSFCLAFQLYFVKI